MTANLLRPNPATLWYFKKYPLEQYHALTVEDDRFMLAMLFAGIPQEAAIQALLVKRWLAKATPVTPVAKEVSKQEN